MFKSSKFRLIFKFLFDKNIPFRKKLWIILPLIYILSPIDLIPFPVLGFSFIDDLVVFIYLMSVVNDKVNKYYDEDEEKENIDNDKIIESVDYKVEED